MKVKVSILYSWFIRTITILLPNIPLFMRFRGALYSLMMKKCGSNFQVCSSTILNSLAGLNVGSNVYIAHNTVVLGTKITIQDNVIVGPNSLVVSGNHTVANGAFRFGRGNEKEIILKKGSWVGGNCTVIAGAVLPEVSVLAGGSTLTKAFIEKGYVYAGNPAEQLKEHTLYDKA